MHHRTEPSSPSRSPRARGLAPLSLCLVCLGGPLGCDDAPDPPEASATESDSNSGAPTTGADATASPTGASSGAGDTGSDGSGDEGTADPSDGGEPETGETSEPADCPAEPEPLSYRGATGEREACGIPYDSPKLDVGPCQDHTLPDTGLEYCVRANPDCTDPNAGCFAVITFNMGPKGLSQTIGGRVNRPDQFGRFVAVGGGTSAQTDQMIELPQVLREQFPGIDPQTIYVLGNSAGNGAISNMLKDPDASSQYAAAAVLAGGIKVPEDYVPPNNLHVVFFNGKNDVEMPNGLQQIAQINGCADPEAPWENITSADPYVPRGDCTDIAERLSAGECASGNVLAYRFKDEGHDSSGYDKHFDPRVRPMRMAFDFFVGRALEGGFVGSASACWK